MLVEDLIKYTQNLQNGNLEMQKQINDMKEVKRMEEEQVKYVE